MSVLATVHFGTGSISLTVGGRWSPSAPEASPLAKAADALSRPPFYEYRPAHGAYGPLLAAYVARKLGGKLELPPRQSGSEPPEGMVF